MCILSRKFIKIRNGNWVILVYELSPLFDLSIFQFLSCFILEADYCYSIVLDQVVQSIVSLTSSLKGQLVKCFTTL